MSTTFAPNPTKTIRNIVADDSDVLGQVRVQPRGMAKLVVGMYENTMPAPKLRVDYGALGIDTVNASLFKFDGDDHYTLVYQFQNYGDTSCLVTVRGE